MGTQSHTAEQWKHEAGVHRLQYTASQFELDRSHSHQKRNMRVPAQSQIERERGRGLAAIEIEGRALLKHGIVYLDFPAPVERAESLTFPWPFKELSSWTVQHDGWALTSGQHIQASLRYIVSKRHAQFSHLTREVVVPGTDGVFPGRVQYQRETSSLSCCVSYNVVFKWPTIGESNRM